MHHSGSLCGWCFIFIDGFVWWLYLLDYSSLHLREAAASLEFLLIWSFFCPHEAKQKKSTPSSNFPRQSSPPPLLQPPSALSRICGFPYSSTGCSVVSGIPLEGPWQFRPRTPPLAAQLLPPIIQQFVYSFVYWWTLSCSNPLAIVNDAAMNMGV